MSTSVSPTEENVATVSAFTEAVFGEHDLSRLDEFVTDDVLERDNAIETMGVVDVRSGFEGMLAAFPDLSMEVLEMVADDDVVMVHAELSGTNEGDLTLLEGTTVPATGSLATWDVMFSARMDDGRMTSLDVVSDRLSIREQLGLLDDA